jgi:hypothetical protein
MRFLLLFIVSIMFLTAVPTRAMENRSNLEVTAVRLEQPLQIDGELLESLYQLTPAAADFIQMEPDNGQPASEKTYVWLGYDDEALYVGARFLDSCPDSIVSRTLRRDVDFESDGFSFAVDSYHDQRSAFWFSVNPAGSIQDGTIANDNQFDSSWDGIWHVQTDMNEEGWSAEFRIPWSQLRFSKAAQQIWGIDFRRDIHRRHEASTMVYHPRDEQGVVSNFGLLNGIENITPPLHLEIIPYLTGSSSLLPSEEDNPLLDGSRHDFNTGLDLKVGLSSSLTLAAAINPDFGQVEVDPSQINLSAFETFFMEKRPFFVEGAGIFRFGRGGPGNRMSLNFMEPVFFYSRRIGRAPQGEIGSNGWVDVPTVTTILGAGKLSGRLGEWSIGCLSAVTAREEAQIEEDDGQRWQQEVEPLTWYGLVRAERELSDGKRGIGFLVTDVRRELSDPDLQEQLNESAASYGIDGWSFLGEQRSWAVSTWAGYTDVRGTTIRISELQDNSTHNFRRPDASHLGFDSTATSLQGWATRFVVNKERGHLFFNGALAFVSPGFEPNDLGLTFRSDVINKHLTMGWRWYEPGRYFRFSMINGSLVSNHNFNGTLTGSMSSIFWYAIFNNFWTTEGFVAQGYEAFNPSLLRGGPLVRDPQFLLSNVYLESDQQKRLSGGLNLEWSHSADWGGSFSCRAEVAFKLGSSFTLEVAPSFSRELNGTQFVDSWEDSAATDMYGTRSLLAHLDQKVIAAEMRFDWSITPRLSLQAFVQPFQAVGSYNSFREFIRPRSYDFMVYGKDVATITADDDWYLLDPTGGDDADEYRVENPDFNYKAFLANMVLRWEFRPGSTLYLVWTRNGNDNENPGDFEWKRDWQRMMTAKTDNVFALKLTWWWGA